MESYNMKTFVSHLFHLWEVDFFFIISILQVDKLRQVEVKQRLYSSSMETLADSKACAFNTVVLMLPSF